jgi:exo-beta-1,3-glucanase (GH17 family)
LRSCPSPCPPSLNTTRLLATLVTPLLAALIGSSGIPEAGADPPEYPFTVRPFQPYSDGHWIGNAICYSPYRDGQHPGGPCPSSAQIREDLSLMASHWSLLRTYGSAGFADTLLATIVAERLDMKVMLGAWIAPADRAANRREIDAAIALAAAYPEIVLAICVGNETQVMWSDHRCPLDSLIGDLRHVRERVSVPVTVADDFSFWKKPESQVLAAEIDFITLHAHPMWNGQQLDGALTWLREQTAAVQTAHPTRGVVVGETGWATSTSKQGEQAELIKGRPGESAQKQFYEAVSAWSEARKLTVFFFEAFDENWKGGTDPTEVEKHWGLFRADRSAKAAVETAGPH